MWHRAGNKHIPGLEEIEKSKYSSLPDWQQRGRGLVCEPTMHIDCQRGFFFDQSGDTRNAATHRARPVVFLPYKVFPRQSEQLHLITDDLSDIHSSHPIKSYKSDTILLKTRFVPCRIPVSNSCSVLDIFRLIGNNIPKLGFFTFPIMTLCTISAMQLITRNP